MTQHAYRRAIFLLRVDILDLSAGPLGKDDTCLMDKFILVVMLDQGHAIIADVLDDLDRIDVAGCFWLGQRWNQHRRGLLVCRRWQQWSIAMMAPVRPV